MLRATMTSPGAIEFSDVAKPSAADGEVLVRILRIGICGSDIHVFHGKHPYTSYPVVQGHEFCGEVVETGRNVTTVSPGDLVTAAPQITCGICPPCREGKYNICDSLRVIGFQAPGVAQEYFAFPESAVLKLPEGTTPEMGALVEPAAVAMHAVGRAGDVTGKRVLVLGAGTIGNLVAQVAQCRGADEVLLTDISDYRLQIARACGIRHTVNTRLGPADAEVRKILGQADVVMECVGAAATAAQAVHCVRKGGVIVIVGVFPEPVPFDLGLIQDREIEVRGTLMYRQNDYLDAIRALSAGNIHGQPLVSKSFPFREYLAAYDFIEANRERVMKVMMEVS
jgi:L-iditol 2-dehydrogenase